MEYKEFLIAKKSGGQRKITAPDAELLRYQRSKLHELEVLWGDIASEYEVDHIQHGFLKNRNCVTAAEKHIGFQSTISMDIANFFDTVTKDAVRKFSSIHGNDIYLYHKDGYCSQGFATSPILCNIVLIPAISDIQDYLDNNFEENAITVYADDIAISTNITDIKILKQITTKVTEVLNQYNFQIKPSKTRIRYSKHGFRRVLGIMVGDSIIKIPRKTKYRLRAALYQAQNSETATDRTAAGHSAGGLTTWSYLQLPKILR